MLNNSWKCQISHFYQWIVEHRIKWMLARHAIILHTYHWWYSPTQGSKSYNSLEYLHQYFIGNNDIHIVYIVSHKDIHDQRNTTFKWSGAWKMTVIWTNDDNIHKVSSKNIIKGQHSQHSAMLLKVNKQVSCYLPHCSMSSWNKIRKRIDLWMMNSTWFCRWELSSVWNMTIHIPFATHSKSLYLGSMHLIKKDTNKKCFGIEKTHLASIKWNK